MCPQTVANTSSACPNNSAQITQFKFNIFGTINYIKTVITKQQQKMHAAQFARPTKYS